MRVAVVGRPNFGTSTLINRILGEDRLIASDVPGTTRDAISVDIVRDGRQYRLVDTAGIRRKGRVELAVEKFSIIKTLQAIDACRSEEHTSELQSLMRISYAVFCLKKKNQRNITNYKRTYKV